MKHDWKDLTREWAVPRGRICRHCGKRQFRIRQIKNPYYVWRPLLGKCQGPKT